MYKETDVDAMKLPELLAPAGNMERLVFAFKYGADAVYCGTKQLSLRSFADNFTIEELAQAAKIAHALGKRIYVTVNAFVKNKDFAQLSSYIAELSKADVDALIVTDPAVIMTIKEVAPELEFHISTQANTLNYKTAAFYHSLGAKRIILARELSLDEIKEIRDNTPPDLELELFVHGAMCVSYSGRCLLSNFVSGRDGNRGECSQPCRWGYEIRQSGTDGEFMPVEQDEQGTYLLNANDLMLLEHLDKLIDAGVSSLKIEGRMKTAFYVASVANAYRMALGAIELGQPFDTAWLAEMQKLRHRPYSSGFLLGSNTAMEGAKGDLYLQTHDFVAVVLEYDEGNKRALVEQRNRFFQDDTLEVLSPGSLSGRVVVSKIVNLDGLQQQSAPHPQQHLWLSVDCPLKPYDILRKELS